MCSVRSVHIKTDCWGAPMRLLIFVVSVSALAASAADARSLQIHGVTGYLSEYDLSASVSGEDSKGKEELSGPLNIKHVGLCTHNGPDEMLSYLKLEFVKASGHSCSSAVRSASAQKSGDAR